MLAPPLTRRICKPAIERGRYAPDGELRGLIEQATSNDFYTFLPRVDRPDQFDQQSAFVAPNYRFDPTAGAKGAFVYDSADRFRICLGGTGSGKTQAAAFKTARHVLEVPPPRPRCPFWIIGESYDQVCQVGWAEKLSLLIPEPVIHSFDWYKTNKRWPFSVMLKHPTIRGEIGWILDFKSYAQGLKGFKAVSIGGYWFNEEVPYAQVFEVQGRCRDYDSPGWADFTPIENRDQEWPEAYEREQRSAGQGQWRFFHLNSKLNTALAPGFFDRYLETVPEDLRELRMIGKFTTLAGAVFKEWNKSIHVIDPDDPEIAKRHGFARNESRIPLHWRKFRGIDFGWNNPFCCLWGARDRDGNWYIYDEHYDTQRPSVFHIAKIRLREWDSTSPEWYGPTYADHDPQLAADWKVYADDLGTTPARKAVNHGIEVLRSLMTPNKETGLPKLFIFSRCRNLIREIPGYRWPDATANRSAQEVPVDKDNHAIAALRYMIYSEHIDTNFHAPTGRRVIRDARRHGVLLEKRA